MYTVQFIGGGVGHKINWNLFDLQGSKEGSLQVFEFFRCSNSGFFYIFHAVNAKPTLLDYVVDVYLVMNLFFSLLIGHCSWPWIVPIGWCNAQILRRHIWPLTNPTMYGISKTPAAGHSNKLLEWYNTFLYSYSYKKAERHKLFT